MTFLTLDDELTGGSKSRSCGDYGSVIVQLWRRDSAVPPTIVTTATSAFQRRFCLKGEKVFLKIRNLLTANDLARLVQLSHELRFIEGRASNPANETKDNLQADLGDPKYTESVQIVNVALGRSREFMDFAMPKRVAPPLLCCYRPGMKYGAHADSALIPVSGTRLRSDLSCTVFISPPESYEGGELSIVVGNQAIAFKGDAGDVMLYPSTTLHEVVPVVSGERLVSITFIESYIADTHQRMQVYELNELAALEGGTMKWENRVRLDVVRQNLMRMWSTT